MLKNKLKKIFAKKGHSQAKTSGSAKATPLPGNTLALEPAPQGASLREVSVEMLPLQNADHLWNFADNFGAGGVDTSSRRLRLKFQLVSIFKDAEVEALWLATDGTASKIPLTAKRIASPWVGEKHPDIAWSAQSRFVVDETVALPDASAKASQIDLLAEIGGTYRKVGIIHIALP